MTSHIEKQPINYWPATVLHPKLPASHFLSPPPPPTPPPLPLQLTRHPGRALGIEIDGGCDTPLNYVFIRSLVQGSVADQCGHFEVGDQVVMVGDECLIGMSHKDAAAIIEKAPNVVTIVAQRKESVKQAPSPQVAMRTHEYDDKRMLSDSPESQSQDSSRPGSRTGSRPGSRPGSRLGSRTGSYEIHEPFARSVAQIGSQSGSLAGTYV